MLIKQAKEKIATLSVVSEVPEFSMEKINIKYIGEKESIEWIVRKGLIIMGVEDVIVRLIDNTIYISRLDK